MLGESSLFCCRRIAMTNDQGDHATNEQHPRLARPASATTGTAVFPGVQLLLFLPYSISAGSVYTTRPEPATSTAFPTQDVPRAPLVQ